MRLNIDPIIKQLQDGIETLFHSDKYKQYLDTMSKFHSYSINNCLLISLQKPDATLVAGYTSWRDNFHRHVMKGEKGITIIAPTPYKKTYEVVVKDAEGRPVLNDDGKPVTEEKVYVHQSYRTATVFDVSQTEGEPLPTIMSDLNNPVENFDDYFDIIKDMSPVPVRFDNITSGAKGYYSPAKHEIVLQRGMSEEQTLKTLLHECAHARLGHGSDDDHLDRSTKEVQAESVAYVCCRALGLDTSEYSFGYIAGWSSGLDQKELKTSLHTIRDQSDQIITGIEQKIQHILTIRQEKQSLDSTPTSTINLSF